MSVYSLDSLENEQIPIRKIQNSLKLCDANETTANACIGRSAKNVIIALEGNSAAKSRKKEGQTVGISGQKVGSHSPRAASPRRLPGRNKRPVSYLELYRRRFNLESLRSPEESSGLSICADNSDRLLNDDYDEVVSRDDRSELSFYRRILNEAKGDTSPRRSYRGLEDAPDTEGFRPYTIEDYRIIRATSAKLDRSLGPDLQDVYAKRERLIRRRSYGDAASALNRQRISSACKKSSTSSGKNLAVGPESRRLKITEGASASSSAKDVVSKNSLAAIPSSRLNRQVVKRNCCSSSGKTGPPRRNESANASSITATRLQSRKSKEGEKVEASLQALRTRHFNEKRMIDQLVARAMLRA